MTLDVQALAVKLAGDIRGWNDKSLYTPPPAPKPATPKVNPNPPLQTKETVRPGASKYAPTDPKYMTLRPGIQSPGSPMAGGAYLGPKGGPMDFTPRQQTVPERVGPTGLTPTQQPHPFDERFYKPILPHEMKPDQFQQWQGQVNEHHAGLQQNKMEQRRQALGGRAERLLQAGYQFDPTQNVWRNGQGRTQPAHDPVPMGIRALQQDAVHKGQPNADAVKRLQDAMVGRDVTGAPAATGIPLPTGLQIPADLSGLEADVQQRLAAGQPKAPDPSAGSPNPLSGLLDSAKGMVPEWATDAYNKGKAGLTGVMGMLTPDNLNRLKTKLNPFDGQQAGPADQAAAPAVAEKPAPESGWDTLLKNPLVSKTLNWGPDALGMDTANTPTWMKGLISIGGPLLLLLVLSKMFGKRASLENYSATERAQAQDLIDRMSKQAFLGSGLQEAPTTFDLSKANFRPEHAEIAKRLAEKTQGGFHAGSAFGPGVAGLLGGALYGAVAPGSDRHGNTRDRKLEALKRGLAGGALGAGAGILGGVTGLHGAHAAFDQALGDENLGIKLPYGLGNLGKTGADKLTSGLRPAPRYSRKGRGPRPDQKFLPGHNFQGSQLRKVNEPSVRQDGAEKMIDDVMGKAAAFAEKMAMSPLLSVRIMQRRVITKPKLQKKQIPSLRAGDNQTPSTTDMAKSKDRKGAFAVETD